MMKIIYLHGLDSSPVAAKALITKEFATQHGIECVCPDLNIPPSEVISLVGGLIDKDSILIGSSLGGYYANLLSDLTGTPAILLNPSIRPYLSFLRFLKDNNFDEHTLTDDTVIYTSTGGWQIVYGDFAWYKSNLLAVKHPDLIQVLLKQGDELLDAELTYGFYQQKNAGVLMQAGGDHRISDYEEQVAMIFDWAAALYDRRWSFSI